MNGLCIAIQARVPVLLWGPPGCGKSTFVTSLGEALGVPVEVVIASIREPSDFAGLPVLADDGVRLHPPAWAVRLASSGKGILFLDEISTAPPAVQAALLRVVLDRQVGDLALPAEVAVVAAANPPEQAAGGWDLSAPLANRFCHLAWVANPFAWADGMVSGWPAPAVPTLPAGWEASLPASRAMVASFIRTRPHLLMMVPQDEAAAGGAWPSPRTWDMAARLLAAARAAVPRLGDDDVADLVAGCVGDGAGTEFLGWYRQLDLPDPEAVLAAPDAFVLPARGDQALAALQGVVAAAVSNLTAERWSAAWTVLSKAAEQGGADVAVVAATTLARARRPGLAVPTAQIKSLLPMMQAGGLL